MSEHVERQPAAGQTAGAMLTVILEEVRQSRAAALAHRDTLRSDVGALRSEVASLRSEVRDLLTRLELERSGRHHFVPAVEAVVREVPPEPAGVEVIATSESGRARYAARHDAALAQEGVSDARGLTTAASVFRVLAAAGQVSAATVQAQLDGRARGAERLGELWPLAAFVEGKAAGSDLAPSKSLTVLRWLATIPDGQPWARFHLLHWRADGCTVGSLLSAERRAEFDAWRKGG